MKKTLVLLLAVFLSSTLVQAKIPEDNLKKHPKYPPHMNQAERIKREQAFEQRLGLTEEQKQQAKLLRIQGKEKIMPIIEEIKAKEAAKESVKKSNLNEKKREKKLNKLNGDLKTLHKQAHDIKVENMKEFESILTDEQKKILKDMKQEGRQEFNKHRMPPKPPEEK